MDICKQEEFRVAKRCMRLIDFDRLIHRCECTYTTTAADTTTPNYDSTDNSTNSDSNIDAHTHTLTTSSGEERSQYICRMSSLLPLSCSPKNNVIIGRYV